MDFKITQSNISSKISDITLSDLTYLIVKETEDIVKESQKMINESKKLLNK
jgi:hypothetical protein